MTYFIVADGGVGYARSNAVCPIVVIASTSVDIRIEIRPIYVTHLRFNVAPNNLQKQHKMWLDHSKNKNTHIVRHITTHTVV